MRTAIFLSLLVVASAQGPARSEVRAKRGEFLVHTLHSGNYFPRAIDVTWSASMVGKPDLPTWMHLAPSRYKAIAFLFGTPVTANRSVEIEIVARSVETFDLSKRIIDVNLIGDEQHQYVGTTSQVAEIIIKNYDPYDFFTDRGQLIPRLETAIRETFRGRRVLAYIADMQPATQAPDEELAFAQRNNRKLGTKVSVGTQVGFHEGVRNLALGLRLRTNAQYCDRNQLVPLDKHFAPTFEVDWCKFQVRNVTNLEAALQQKKQQQMAEVASNSADSIVDSDSSIANESLHYDTDRRPILRRSYFWDWIMIVPVPAVGLILLILLLSFIFFGRREGQHWRDYKTPKHQLQEYISLRQTQDQLRDLSAQRQMLLPVDERNPPSPPPHPPGIQSYLRPKNGSVVASVAPTQRSASIAPESTSPTAAAASAAVGPVGKQTVAEAAKARGSSLNLYRNPSKEEELDEEEEEEEEEEEADEDEQRRASIDIRNSSTKLAPNDWGI